MKVINYWEHFLMTGSVSDYLNYLGECQSEESAEPVRGKALTGIREDEGAEKVEGTGQRYRDDIEGGTHRGI